jgi:hypothetical protein
LIYRDDVAARELRLHALRAEVAVLERARVPAVARLRASVRAEARRLERLHRAGLPRLWPRSICETIVAAWMAFSVVTIGSGLVFAVAFVVALIHHV